jgi:hypothetical protein
VLGRCVTFILCLAILGSCSLTALESLGNARITLEEFWKLALAGAAILSVFPGLWSYLARAWPYVVETIAVASLASVSMEICFGRPKKPCLYAYLFYAASFLALSWNFDQGESNGRKQD